MDASLDEVIISYLREPNDATAATLAATGSAGARRVLDVYVGQASLSEEDLMPGVSGSERGDRWSMALEIVARSAPSAFVDRIAGLGRIPLAVLSMLGVVDDPRATAILCQYVDDADWHYRCNAVKALARRNDVDGRRCIERALDDEHRVVRDAARRASQWWK